MPNSYPVGTDVKCQMSFYSDAAKTVLADPTSIKFRKKTPTGVVTEHVYPADSALVKSATGVYYDLVNPDAAGEWTYSFTGTGAVAIVAQAVFEATRTIFQD